MPSRMTTAPMPMPRTAVASYAFLLAMGAAFCAERLMHATTGISADPASASATASVAPQLFDQISVTVDVWTLRAQMTLAHFYFDWIAPIGDKFAALAAVPDHMLAAVASLNPFGDITPIITIGKHQFVLSL